MPVVVGLGNPGPAYAGTRHNIGFLVAEGLLGGRGKWTREEAAETARARIAGEEVLLVRPQSFMNRSGEAVRMLQERRGLAPEEILVILDDFLLDFGRLRIRRRGSDGGHNGLASVLKVLQTDQVPRLRLGVGPVPPGESDIDFVLAPFAPGEEVAGLVERGCAAARCWLAEGIEAAMNRFNGFPALERTAPSAASERDEEDR